MKIGEFFDRLAGAKPDRQPDDEQIVSHQAQIQHAKLSSLLVRRGVLVAFIIGASFFIGAVYQKSQQPRTEALSTNGTSSGNSQLNQSQSGGFSGGNPGGFGQERRSSMTTSQVTAISSTSITTKDADGTSSTYAITSDTRITDNGQQITATDISVGDTVIVIPNWNSTNDARRIIVNPSLDNAPQPNSIAPGEAQLN